MLFKHHSTQVFVCISSLLEVVENLGAMAPFAACMCQNVAALGSCLWVVVERRVGA